ncbi:MAG: hypothetical protein QOJ89_5388 [bacterium]
MRRIALAAIAVGCALLLPAPAVAGAPNYDCVAGDAHLAIDQYVDVVAASGFTPGHVVWGTASKVEQDGPSLDLVATFGGTSWKVAIRGGGRSLVVTGPGGRLTGHCQFIPGNFALRRADRGGSALRAGPSGQARRFVPIPAGTPVWERPDRAHKGDWFAVDAYIARGGALAFRSGWLRQLKPSVLR